MKWLINAWWTALIIVGLGIALREYVPLLLPVTEVPKIKAVVSSPIPKPTLIVKDKKTGKTHEVEIDGYTELKIPSEQYDIAVNTSSSPSEPEAAKNKKDWTEYGDKIVGWLVALAGAYNLIKRTHQTPVPVPVESDTARVIAGRRKK